MAKAKPRRPSTTCSSTRTVPIREGIRIDIEPETSSPIAFSSVKTKEYSSSAWTSTSRRKWSDRILETER